MNNARPVRSAAAMLGVYQHLIQTYVQGAISADEFETRYIQVFTNDAHHVRGPAVNLLENLFFDVDDYVSDPELRRRVGGLSGEQLRERANVTYAELYGS